MKINLLVVFLLASLFLNAQIKKGGLFIGGDVFINTTNATSTNPNTYTSKNENYGFSPSLGWVVKENVVVGGSVLLSFYNNEQQPGSHVNRSNRIGGGIWMRKYLPLGKSFYLFGNASLNVQSIYNKYSMVQQPYYAEEKGYTINAALTPGVSYQLKNNLFLEVALNSIVALGYERKNKEEQTQNGPVYKGTSNSYNMYSSLGNGVPLQVGMRWIIAKKTD